MKQKIIVILIILAILLFPLDIGILVNKALGMGTHIILYIVLIGIIIYLMKGKTLREKINNLKREITKRIK